MDDKLLNATDVEFQTSGTDRPDRRRRVDDEGEIYNLQCRTREFLKSSFLPLSCASKIFDIFPRLLRITRGDAAMEKEIYRLSEGVSESHISLRTGRRQTLGRDDIFCLSGNVKAARTRRGLFQRPSHSTKRNAEYRGP